MKTLTTIFAISLLTLTSLVQSQWQQVHGNSNQFLYRVSAFNSNVIVATGESGLILRSDNGGSNWQQDTSGTNYAIENLSVKGNIGLAASRYGVVLLKTTDQGLSWSRINVNWQSNFQIVSVNVLNDYTFYAVTSGYFNMYYWYHVYKSTNGGASWTEVPNTIPSVSSVDLHFVNELTGFMIAGLSVYKTTNGGLNWSYLTNVNASSVSVPSIEFISENTGYICANEYTGYNNYSNRLYKTTNGGINWTLQSLPNSLGIWNMSFLDANHGMIVADSGITFRTINGGINWTSEPTGSLNRLRDICVNGSNTAITVGDYSVIFKYNDLTGINQTNNQIPEGFSLSQNYPNPFNPSTSIKFSIPASSNVRLMVFNSAGQEVENLVNEQLSAGTYEYKFDASKLSSGVYFYRLITDNFTDTKKMMLVK